LYLHDLLWEKTDKKREFLKKETVNTVPGSLWKGYNIDSP